MGSRRPGEARGDSRNLLLVDGQGSVYLLYAYQKNTQTDLTQEQIRQLGKLVEQELRYE